MLSSQDRHHSLRVLEPDGPRVVLHLKQSVLTVLIDLTKSDRNSKIQKKQKQKISFEIP